MEIKNIYVELDCLFDTRLAFATLLDPESVSQAYQDGSYFNRVTYSIGNISGEVLELLYKTRNKLILSYALQTNLFPIIREYYANIMTDPEAVNRATLQNSILYVNTCPYVFTIEEDQHLMKLIGNIIPGIDIKFVYIEDHELTPEYVKKEKIDIVLMYRGIDWLNRCVESLGILDNNLISVTVGTPYLLQNSMVYKGKRSDQELAEYMQDMFTMIANLVLLPAKDFSAIDITKKIKS